MVVPVGALASATELSLCPESAPLAGALGPGFQAGPEGQTFLQLVEITVAFDATRLPVGSDSNAVQMWMAPEG